MKTDLYTKILLTIIAINLTYFSIKDVSFFQPVQANINSNTSLNNSTGTMDVNIVSCSPTLDVNLEEINGYGSFYKDTDGKAMLVPVYAPFGN